MSDNPNLIPEVHQHYGRMRKTRCITGVYGHTMGCSADVTTHLESLCSGRTNCTVVVGTLDLVAQPCNKDFKSYLEASYKCARGKSAPFTYTSSCNNAN